ncbi:hypothetical protein [Asticcacaulis sp. AC402]|uniref:hypothetical protein n=1 Tax=Asticcacaulis sp. AC402 TaxID=1282361 RepID=UPI00190F9D65|nr:hypothetical protein [Asticcacaulis sp. AC402]
MRQPVEIIRNGRTHTVLISADCYELLTRGRIVRRIEDIDNKTLKAIAAARVPAEFMQLDATLGLMDAKGFASHAPSRAPSRFLMVEKVTPTPLNQSPQNDDCPAEQRVVKARACDCFWHRA